MLPFSSIVWGSGGENNHPVCCFSSCPGKVGCDACICLWLCRDTLGEEDEGSPRAGATLLFLSEAAAASPLISTLQMAARCKGPAPSPHQSTLHAVTSLPKSREPIAPCWGCPFWKLQLQSTKLHLGLWRVLWACPAPWEPCSWRGWWLCQDGLLQGTVPSGVNSLGDPGSTQISEIKACNAA